MVTIRELRKLDMGGIEEYFDTILSSKADGDIATAKELFSSMDEKQQEHFFTHIETAHYIGAYELRNLKNELL